MKVSEMNSVMREAVKKMNPTLECRFADGEYFEDQFYMSIHCTAIDGSCSYRTAEKDRYTDCKILRDRS